MPRTVYEDRLKNVGAFLDMIAESEIGEEMLAASDDGYNVDVGSVPGKMILFPSYADHPRLMENLGHGLFSDAAGRYQILSTYWPHYKAQLKLPDFGPESQDAYAVQQIRERTAYPDVLMGRIGVAIMKCSNIWASFPGAAYGQHTNKMDALIAAYKAAGGTVT